MNFKFYLSPYESPTKSNYQHLSVALAEGFLTLKVTFYGNIDYWYDLDKKEYTIKRAPLSCNADVHIYNISYFRNSPEIKVDLSKKNILLDASDGILNEVHEKKFEKFDLILKTHYNQYIKYPRNVKPWAFGITNRMLQECEKSLSKPKAIDILQNFRVKHHLREHIKTQLTPRLISASFNVEEIITTSSESNDSMAYWAQTGRRHNEEYYELLNQSLFTYSFGGDLSPKSIEPNLHYIFFRRSYVIRRKAYRLLRVRSKALTCLCQFDSWRFWESLISTAVPMHVDLVKYGCNFPEMPSNWIHYIGVEDIFQLDDFVRKVSDLTTDEIRKIAMEGRKWALQNYSPEDTAKRFISLIQ